MRGVKSGSRSVLKLSSYVYFLFMLCGEELKLTRKDVWLLGVNP